MGGCARRLGGDEETWGVIGLFHDFDYECWPGSADHMEKSAAILRERDGVDEEIIGAIWIVTVAYVRPGHLVGMKASSVKKKME